MSDPWYKTVQSHLVIDSKLVYDHVIVMQIKLTWAKHRKLHLKLRLYLDTSTHVHGNLFGTLWYVSPTAMRVTWVHRVPGDFRIWA